MSREIEMERWSKRKFFRISRTNGTSKEVKQRVQICYEQQRTFLVSESTCDRLKQWFWTLGRWKPVRKNKTQFVQLIFYTNTTRKQIFGIQM